MISLSNHEERGHVLKVVLRRPGDCGRVALLALGRDWETEVLCWQDVKQSGSAIGHKPGDKTTVFGKENSALLICFELTPYKTILFTKGFLSVLFM